MAGKMPAITLRLVGALRAGWSATAMQGASATPEALGRPPAKRGSSLPLPGPLPRSRPASLSLVSSVSVAEYYSRVVQRRCHYLPSWRTRTRGRGLRA